MARSARAAVGYGDVLVALEYEGDLPLIEGWGFFRRKGAGAMVANVLGGGAMWDRVAGRPQSADVEIRFMLTQHKLLIFTEQRRSLQLAS